MGIYDQEKDSDFIVDSRQHRISLVIVLMVSLFYILTARVVFNYDHDSSYYLGLADSLLAGKGYHFNGSPHTLYPPGFPLLIAAVRALGIQSLQGIYQCIALLGGAGLFLTYAFYRHRDLRHPLLPVLLIGACPFYYLYSTAGIMSDIPYLAFSLAFLFRAEKQTSREAPRFVMLIPGAFLLLFALALRSIGIALVGGLCLALIHQTLRTSSWRHWKNNQYIYLAVLLMVGITFALAWQGWTIARTEQLFPGQFRHSYLEQIKLRDAHHPDLGTVTPVQIILRLPGSLWQTTAYLAEILTHLIWIKPNWYSPPVLFLLILTGAGWYREMKRPMPLIAWYLFCYLGIVLLWPYREGRRFLIGILPLLILLLIQGMEQVFTWMDKVSARKLAWGGTLAAFLIFAGGVASTLLSGDTSRQDQLSLAFWFCLGAVFLMQLALKGEMTLPRPFLKRYLQIAGLSFFAIYLALGSWKIAGLARDNHAPDINNLRYIGDLRASEWIEENALPQEVIMAENPPTLHYLTGRKVYPLPITLNPTVIQSALDTLQPDYIVINDPLEHPYFLPYEVERLEVIKQLYPDRIQLIHRHEGGSIYRFLNEV